MVPGLFQDGVRITWREWKGESRLIFSLVSTSVTLLTENRVQIQILLYFLKLSLPGSPPPPPESTKKQKRSREPPTPSTTTEDELEAFMDKLSMWQLIGNLDIVGVPGTKEERDWTQIFAEDIVERQ